MTEGGDFGYEDPYLDHDIDHDDDDESRPLLRNETGSFTTSTPAYQNRAREEIEMKTFQEKSGRPGTSYTETSFGGTEDLERRLDNLKRDRITGMLNTEGIPDVENPMSFEEKGREVIRARIFIKKRFPNVNVGKLILTFSEKKPMDIVTLGPQKGEYKVFKKNGTDFQKSFLDNPYLKNILGKSFEQIQLETNQQLLEEKKELADLVKKSPEKKGLIDALKDKISKKETEKKEKEREFYRTKQTEEIKKQNEKDRKVLNDENAFPQDKKAAEERIAQRNEELAGLQTLVQEREEAMPLRERVKQIFKKYGVTVASIFIAAGVTIAAVVGTITNALKKLGKELGKGLKALGSKAADVLPGLLGAIAKFLFKAAASAVSFLAEHTWLLILAVVAFLFQKLMKKN